MSHYVRPSFIELNARINADLSIIPEVLAEPLAAMWARACHSQHGYLDWILKQCSPLTCDLDHLYDWAVLYNVQRLLPVAAQGPVWAKGNAGAIVLADSLLRAANGLDYRVLSAVTLAGSQTAITVRCTTTGAVTNVPAEQILTLIDPLTGVNSLMRVGSLGLTGGADIESLDAWRLRVVEEWQHQVLYGGRSGKPGDYVAWAKAAHPDVSGALVQPQAWGPGTVIVRPICNGLTNRLPTTEIINAVAAYLPPVAPAVADWRIVAPMVQTVQIELAIDPLLDTADNRHAITDILSVLVNTKLSNTAELLLTEIDAAVLSIVSDVTRTAPTANITAEPGKVLVLLPIIFS